MSGLPEQRWLTSSALLSCFSQIPRHLWKRWRAASWERHIVNDSSQKKHLDVTPHRPLSRWGQIRPDFNAQPKLIWSHLITLGTVCSLFLSKHLERSSQFFLADIYVLSEGPDSRLGARVHWFCLKNQGISLWLQKITTYGGICTS